MKETAVAVAARSDRQAGKPLFFQHRVLAGALGVLRDRQSDFTRGSAEAERIVMLPDFEPRLNGKRIRIVPAPPVDCESVHVCGLDAQAGQHLCQLFAGLDRCVAFAPIDLFHFDALQQFRAVEDRHSAVMGELQTAYQHGISYKSNVTMFSPSAEP